MATLTYFIRTAKKNTQTTVRVRFRHGELYRWAATREITDTTFWHSKHQRAVVKSSNQEDHQRADKLNNTLDELKKIIYNEWNLLSDKQIPENWLQNIIDNYYLQKQKQQKQNPEPTMARETFSGYMARYIREITEGTRLTIKNRKFSRDTIKTYRNTAKLIQNFMESYTICDFEDIDLTFYNKFIEYCLNKAYTPQTIGKYISILKIFINHSRTEGLHKNIITQDKQFSSPFEQSDTIYLTREEVNNILNIDLTGRPRMQLSRDIFCVGVFTAQRYSDYSKTSAAHRCELPNGKTALKYIQQKTGKTVYIPISPVLDKILSQYNYNLPKNYEQKVNEDIKEIARLAGITQNIEHREHKGREIHTHTVPKNTLVTTHTARRTGATLLYLQTRDPLTCMKITGHQSIKEFLKYIRVTDIENAMMLSQIDYFN